MPALLLSILTPLFLLRLLLYLISVALAVPIHECLGKQSRMSSPFPIAILNGTFFFARRNSPCFGRSFACQNIIIPLLVNFLYLIP